MRRPEKRLRLDSSSADEEGQEAQVVDAGPPPADEVSSTVTLPDDHPAEDGDSSATEYFSAEDTSFTDIQSTTAAVAAENETTPAPRAPEPVLSAKREMKLYLRKRTYSEATASDDTPSSDADTVDTLSLNTDVS